MMATAKPKAERPWLSFLNSVALVATAISAGIAAWQLILVQRGLHEQRQLEWQEVTVYRIVRNAKLIGATFEEIKSAYRTAAEHDADIVLPKEELQDLAITQILMNLESKGLVATTMDNKYAVDRSMIDPRSERAIARREAQYVIYGHVKQNGGKYTVAELRDAVQLDPPLPNEEYHLLLDDLLAAQYLTRDDKGKLWVGIDRPEVRAEEKADKQP